MNNFNLNIGINVKSLFKLEECSNEVILLLSSNCPICNSALEEFTSMENAVDIKYKIFLIQNDDISKQNKFLDLFKELKISILPKEQADKLYMTGTPFFLIVNSIGTITGTTNVPKVAVRKFNALKGGENHA